MLHPVINSNQSNFSCHPITRALETGQRAFLSFVSSLFARIALLARRYVRHAPLLEKEPSILRPNFQRAVINVTEISGQATPQKDTQEATEAKQWKLALACCRHVICYGI